ncbi:MAG: zinc ribbon domain-containing protein [Thermoplasmata archaeon]|nr:zinc ribbon domain-containing protein [Thermoplasmata archaeon]
MVVCTNCSTVGATGALFCLKCGRTLPQGEPAVVVAAAPGVYLWNAASPTLGAGVPPPPQWIPRELQGRAIHCPRCNTLISPVAVVCPVCQAELRGSGAAAGAVEPPR